MITNFLILSCIGKNDKVGIKVDNNFFIHNFHKKNNNNDQLVLSILNLIKKYKVNINKDFSILVNNGPGSFSSIRVSLAVAKGIKISNTEPLYVINIDSEKNSIIVGPKESLIVKKIELRDLNILGNEKNFNDKIKIKVRSTGKLLNAEIKIKGKYADIKILDDETGISPGQACVFYYKDNIGDKVLGGGWIHKTENKNLST